MNTFGKGLGSLIPGSAASAPPPPSVVKAILPTHEAVESDTLEVLLVSPGRVDPNPDQPRSFFDPEKIQELQDSIAKHGILEPLIVTQKPDGRFELIAGERRLRAAKNLDLKTVPVLVRHADDLERLELSLIENLQRQDLNPIEEAEGYRELIETFGLTQEETAKRVGKSRETISHLLRLLELPVEMQRSIAQGGLSLTHARLLLALDNPRTREMIYKAMVERRLSVKEAELLAAPKLRHKRAGLKDPAILADETRLREELNTKVQIEKRNGRGKIVIQFYSDEDYAELIGKLIVA